ncbi:GM13172 [Drosophila sechellia]|uniref:GM13172 n=1 Tax=Drosophila sechellia TaxID=7238 RepID=B4IPP2_DROSE|nr:GM13172 [Drosophila sechellia]
MAASTWTSGCRRPRSWGVQELTRSASSISMRTDASGQGENPSSDSFYDSDKEETQAQAAAQTKPKAGATVIQGSYLLPIVRMNPKCVLRRRQLLLQLLPRHP